MEIETVEIAVYDNPLPGSEPRRIAAPVGTLIKDCITERAPYVCLIDGVPMKREYWQQRAIYSGDVIELRCVYLGGKGNSASILSIVASIALMVAAPYMAAAIGAATGIATGTAAALTVAGHLIAAGIVLAGNALISALVRPYISGGSSNQMEQPSSVYNVDTQGNAAKLFAPIPVQYGRIKIYPEYAAQPFAIYDTTGNKDGDQFYFALFCVGQGEYEINQSDILIANSPLYAFKDVLVARVLKPGEKPKSVSARVIASEAVAGQSLDGGQYVGAYPTCQSGFKVNKISVSIVFPSGLARIDDKGKAQHRSVMFGIDVAPIDDSGVQVGNNMQFNNQGWFNVLAVNIGAASVTPQRRSFVIDLLPGRYYVRAWLQNPKNKDDNRDIASAVWESMYAELVDAAPLCPTATHFELVIRASDQLSSLSQRKISITCTRKVKDFNGNLIPSRSPVLALLDKWTNPDYGDGMPTDRIDFDALRALQSVIESRGDWFDFRFENSMASEEADQLIAKTFRSVVLQRNGVKTVVRDSLADLPITAFNPTNIAEGSTSIEYIQVTDETPDGVIVEFFNNVSWSWEDAQCPAPNRTYLNSSHDGYNPALPRMKKPVRIKFDGITDRLHALREGTYLAYTNALRRRFISFDTEMQGILVYYGAPVMVASTLYNAGNGGEVVDVNGNGDVRLSGDVPAGGQLVFLRKNGMATQPVSYYGLGDGWIRIDGNAGIDIDPGSYNSDRTRYVVVEGEIIRHIVKVIGVRPRGMGDNGAPMYGIDGVVDVPEVHSADLKFLPEPEEDDPDPPAPPQPPAPPPDVPPAPVIPVVSLTNERIVILTSAASQSSGYPATIVLKSNGELWGHWFFGKEILSPAKVVADQHGWHTYGAWTNPVNWLSPYPIENAGARFEARVCFQIENMKFRNNVSVFAIPREQIESFMWLDGNQRPASNFIFDGLHLWKDVRANMYYSDWQSLAKDVEFRGLKRTFGMFKPAGSVIPVLVDPFRISGRLEIREKATGTIQAVVDFELGFFTEDI